MPQSRGNYITSAVMAHACGKHGNFIWFFKTMTSVSLTLKRREAVLSIFSMYDYRAFQVLQEKKRTWDHVPHIA